MMEYSAVANYEWIYDDGSVPETASDSVKMKALSGSYASFQLLCRNVKDGVKLSADFDCEIYEGVSVMVEDNPELEYSLPLTVEKKAPFRVYDCLKKSDGEAAGETVVFYIAAKTKDCDISGTITLSDSLTTLSVPVEITVLPAPLPKETLKILMGLSYYEIYKRHGDNREAVLEYRAALRRMRQNRLYISLPHGRFENGKWEFLFGHIEGLIEAGLSEGFTAFHFEGLGFRKSWSGPEILVCRQSLDSESPEGDLYIKSFLAALKDFIDKKGYDPKAFSLGVADEPNEYNAETYRALCRKIKEYYPEISIYEAVSAVDVGDDLDIYVPQSIEYEKSKDFFDEKKKNREVWQYVCLYPRGGGYINRFLDLPLLSTRFIYWGNYLYDLSGYLHWAVNSYQPGCENPFEKSCGVHRNADSVTILPPGDDKLIYPGDKGNYAMISMRLENHRESAEEYEMLRIIEKKDKALADSLCRRALTSFHNANYSLSDFTRLRSDLLDAYCDACKKGGEGV